jgi:hypothetical protein
MIDPKEKREMLQSEARDKTAKIIAGILPMGSAAYELITTILVPLHEKKKWEFINDLATRLKRLEEQGRIDFEELAQNEEFNTIITKAILLAQQNHQKEKLKALRNIVINFADYQKMKDNQFDWTAHFLSVIDRISPLHILLLKTFQDPHSMIEEKRATFDDKSSFTSGELFFKLYPDLRGRSSLINQCWQDLKILGFLVNESFDKESRMVATLHSKDKILPKTTDFGNKFLDMIESDE